MIIEHVGGDYDHEYQPRLKGRFPDGCAVCNKVHEDLVVHLDKSFGS